MLVVSTREFRDKQRMYLDLARSGEDIILKSRGNGSFKLVPVPEKDDTLMSKEEFFAKIERARQSIKEGKGRTIRSKQELLDYLDSL